MIKTVQHIWKGMRWVVPAIAFSLVSLLYGCTDADPAAFDTAQMGTRIPHAGSLYSYSITYRDSTGEFDPDTEGEMTAVVLAKEVSYSGESGTVKILDGADTIYVRQEDSGDLLLYATIPGSQFTAKWSNWVRLPFGTTEVLPIQELQYDTTIIHPLYGEIEAKINGEVVFAGREQVEVNGRNITSSKAIVTVTADVSVQGAPFKVVLLEEQVWFGHEVGYITREDRKQAYISEDGTILYDGYYRELTDYHLN